MINGFLDMLFPPGFFLNSLYHYFQVIQCFPCQKFIKRKLEKLNLKIINNNIYHT